MKMTGDQTLIKRMNKSLILDTIIANAPTSRADISAAIGMNKASVSSLVGEWLEERMVLETGLGASSGGRKPVMLLFNKQAGYAVGVDLAVSYISAVLTDLSGQVAHRLRQRLDTSDPKDVLERVTAAVRALMADAPGSPYGVVGVGIGVPGIVTEDGVVLKAPNLGWNGVNMREPIEAELKLPVVIDNEANAGAIGEKQYGIGRDAGHLVYISAGVGIGTGLIMNDAIFRGSSGYAGEFGHMTIQTDGGLVCGCGNTGCWEMYASENALRPLPGETPRELEQWVRLAAAGDEAAVARLSSVGRYLGIGVAAIMNAFNPDMIIIGNRLGLARQWLEGGVLDTVERSALRFHRERSRIEFASLGLDSAALGAASSAISRFLESAKAGEALVAGQPTQ